MIDVHCHLNYPPFEEDKEDIIKDAFKNGVTGLINTGTNLDKSRGSVELAKAHDKIWAVVGVHPHHAEEMTDGWIKELTEIANNEKVVGIGECGLDYYEHEVGKVPNKDVQKRIFEAQIEIASRLSLPLQIHNRLAGEDILEILRHHKSQLNDIPGMFHCMSGNLELLKKVLDLGFYVGFDGNITYEGIAKGEDTPLSDLVSYTPLDRIVTETDSPYLAPKPYRGSRNIPSHVIIVGRSIAKIKGVSFEEVRTISSQNALKIFNLNHNIK